MLTNAIRIKQLTFRMELTMKSEKQTKWKFNAQARPASRHEAGHLVMNWYLGLPATCTELFDGDNGICHGTGDEIRLDEEKFQCAAGWAAEYRSKPLIIERFLADYVCSYGKMKDDEYRDLLENTEIESDLDRLWHQGEALELPREMNVKRCISAFYEARDILLRYKAHVDEATSLLLMHRSIEEKQAQHLFRVWGNPEHVFPDMKKIFRRLEIVDRNHAKKEWLPA